eukprot:2488056-Prymnesium_polylepis.2
MSVSPTRENTADSIPPLGRLATFPSLVFAASRGKLGCKDRRRPARRQPQPNGRALQLLELRRVGHLDTLVLPGSSSARRLRILLAEGVRDEHCTIAHPQHLRAHAASAVCLEPEEESRRAHNKRRREQTGRGRRSARTTRRREPDERVTRRRRERDKVGARARMRSVAARVCNGVRRAHVNTGQSA